jgi:hypothetical protein
MAAVEVIMRFGANRPKKIEHKKERSDDNLKDIASAKYDRRLPNGDSEIERRFKQSIKTSPISSSSSVNHDIEDPDL